MLLLYSDYFPRPHSFSSFMFSMNIMHIDDTAITVIHCSIPTHNSYIPTHYFNLKFILRHSILQSAAGFGA